MVGPAVVILYAAKVSPDGAGIALLNPPLRAEGEAATGTAGRARRRQWLGARMVAVLTMGCGTTMLLGGVDLASIAALEKAGQVSWASVVVATFGVTTVMGGLVYGALHRAMPTWRLLGLLGLATIPVGLAHDWPWLCVALIVAGLLTAPSLATISDTSAGWRRPAFEVRRPACNPQR